MLSQVGSEFPAKDLNVSHCILFCNSTMVVSTFEDGQQAAFPGHRLKAGLAHFYGGWLASGFTTGG